MAKQSVFIDKLIILSSMSNITYIKSMSYKKKTDQQFSLLELISQVLLVLLRYYFYRYSISSTHFLLSIFVKLDNAKAFERLELV